MGRCDRLGTAWARAVVGRSGQQIIANSAYFASANLSLRHPETGSSVIAPDGRCAGHAAYGEEGLLLVDLAPAAKGVYARCLPRKRPGE